MIGIDGLYIVETSCLLYIYVRSSFSNIYLLCEIKTPCLLAHLVIYNGTESSNNYNICYYFTITVFVSCEKHSL